MGSWIWKKLLKYREHAKTFYFSEVKSGLHTSFWFDKWCPLGVLYDHLGYRGFIDMGINVDATVAEALLRRPRRHRRQLLNQVENELHKVRGSNHQQDMDVPKWRRSDGTFSPSFSSWETWRQVRTEGEEFPGHDGIWFSGATPKYSFILWLASHNRLSTGDRMTHWNTGVTPHCVFCQHPLESRDHLFFDCPFSATVWEALTRSLLHQRYTTSFSGLLSLVSGTSYTGTTRFILRYVLQVTIYTLWQERNRRRHGDLPQSAEQLTSHIDRTVRNRISSHRLTSSKFEDGLRIWFRSRS